MQTRPMPTTGRTYPAGLPEHLRSWYDEIPPGDCEDLTPDEISAIAAARRENEPGISSEDLARRLRAPDEP